MKVINGLGLGAFTAHRPTGTYPVVGIRNKQGRPQTTAVANLTRARPAVLHQQLVETCILSKTPPRQAYLEGY